MFTNRVNKRLKRKHILIHTKKEICTGVLRGNVKLQQPAQLSDN